MCVLTKQSQYQLHMRRDNVVVSEHLKHERADARVHVRPEASCGLDTQHARQARQSSAEPHLREEAGWAEGPLWGRLQGETPCHLPPPPPPLLTQTHTHRVTQ